MIKHFKIVFLLLLCFCCVQTTVFAEESTEQQPQIEEQQEKETVKYTYADNKYAIISSYKKVLQDDWEKYFNKQTKLLKKSWKKEVKLKDDKYKTSYARVLFFVNRNGNILSYQIKSSCIPKDDKIFMNSVEDTIKKIGKFNPLPSNYNNDLIVFTVKFNSYIPKKYQNSKNVEWDRYGIADIELSQNKSYFLLEK